MSRLLRCVATASLGLGLIAALPLSASAAEFTWSAPTDPQTMDPHEVNTTPVLGFLNNIYEGLVRRNAEMAIEGSLAERWEALDTDGWRFHLRKGVTFHDGAAFDAEDVYFSYERAASEASDTSSWFAPVREVRVVDAHTIDFLTHQPDPLFPDSIANFMIMDKGWAEANNAARPDKENATFASLNANGTGPFRLETREPGVKTVLVPHDGWWDTREDNVTRATFLPIGNAATSVAALLTGEVDMINPVPVQDIARIEATEGLTLHRGIEARVIMLGFAHQADTLLGGEADSGNPLKDATVRAAIARAIDAKAIVDKIMRGNGAVASQLVSSQMKGYSEQAAERPAYDPDAAKAALEAAGLGDGLTLTFACTNDRYINDEAVCKAIASMLARVGVTVELTTMPVRSYWDTLRAGEFDMYLLGWSPGTFDAEHPVRFLVATPNPEKKLGSWNFGGYSSERVDTLLPQVQREIDPAARQAMLDEIAAIVQDETAYVPLHVQPLLWGSKSSVSLVQRPDNFFLLRWVTIAE
ncbi:ABC transporter substrate-binding protein [Stappia stellulata]|uniref:ABC transporter substrate-binding protein n=1 Tax=Stappia stellulata TaxID=71235 RepID=UPI001CD46914|nr:ABC transporter substrate-binding protein [Stappia stellulata]MCA1243950.1 ABC transporter substrate-binding protein [Stappia stellulata]